MQVTILYIGKDPEITRVMERLLNARPEWKGVAVCEEAEALAFCRAQCPDLVLLGNGIAPDAEKWLRSELKAVKSDLKVVQHYGGGSGLLYGEIQVALNS